MMSINTSNGSFSAYSVFLLCLILGMFAVLSTSCDDGDLNPLVTEDSGADTDNDTDTDTDADTDADTDSDADTDTDTDTDTDADSDADNDSDSDVDSDSDSDSDTETELSCPTNSGYPCACDRHDETCDDGSDCLFLFNNDEIGICTLPCSPWPGDQCENTMGFGVPGPAPAGWCGLNGMDPTSGDHLDRCVVVCGAEGDTGPCPPYLDCEEHPSEEVPPIRICLPHAQDGP